MNQSTVAVLRSPSFTVLVGGGGGGGGAGVQATRADALVDTWGFNIHLNADPVNVSFAPVTLPTLVDIGIRTARIGMFDNTDGSSQSMANALYFDGGLHLCCVMNAGSPYSSTTITDQFLAAVDPRAVWYAEGFNEVDNNLGAYGSSYANVITAFNAQADDIHSSGNAYIAAIKVTTPTVTSHSGALGLGDRSAKGDYGAVHPYMLQSPGQVEPGASFSTLVTDVNPVFGNGSLPFIVTETGYHTNPNNTSPSYFLNSGVSQLAQSKYGMRTFLEFVSQGAKTVYWYDYINDGSATTDGEQAFGLLTYAGGYKTFATTLKNAIAIQSERVVTPSSFAIGSSYFKANFAVSDRTGFPNGTGSDTSLAWVDGDANMTGHWSIVSGHGVAVQSSQIRAWGGDNHGSGSTDAERTFLSLSNIRAGFSQSCRVYCRYGTDYTSSIEFSANPGVSQQIQLTINHSGATTLIFNSKASIATLTSMKMEMIAVNDGSGNIVVYARAYDAAGATPTTWDFIYKIKGGVALLGAGKGAMWIDNNGSGQTINILDFDHAPVTYTAASLPSLSALTLGKLDFTLSGAMTSVQSYLTQKGDGSFNLWVWNRDNVWNNSTHADISNTARACTITFNSGGTRNVSQINPRTGTSGTTLGTAVASCAVSITDEPTCLVIV